MISNNKYCVLLLAGLAMTASPAMAQDRCGMQMDAVETAISAGIFTGKRADSDQSNLLAKYAAAVGKISLGKYSDAIDKLEDISDKATALADAPKAKLDDATAINEAVSAAIWCVGELPPLEEE